MSPVWPKYSGFAIRDLKIAVRFLADARRLRPMVTILLLITVYVGGLFTPIPGSLQVAGQGERWWFLTMLDWLLTGGALGRGCIFGMGLFAPLLLGAGTRARKGLLIAVLRPTLGLGLVAALLAMTLRVKGVIRPGAAEFGMAVFWLALGGLILKLVNTSMMRHRGPAPFYINLFVTLAVSVRGAVEKLLQAHRPLLVWMIAISIGFIIVSGFLVLRYRIYIDVESIKSAETRRKAKLEIVPVDEPLLDSIGELCLIIYLCIAGCMSLAFGWRTLTPGNYAAFLVVSVLAFALVWSTFAMVERLWNRIRPLDEANVFSLTDPHEYALRMLNHFWIVPGCRAGPDTEAYISQRLTVAVKRTFLLLASWVLIAFSLQYLLSKANAAAVLFPYSPLVFVFMVLMVVGNLSMLLRHAGASLNQFRQLMRGQSRVLAETYPLGSPHKASRLTMDAEYQNYWQEEKLSEQLADVIDWMKLVREMQLQQPRTRRPRLAILEHVRRLAANLVTGVVVTFVAGVLCVFFYPDISQRDLGLVALPLLVSSVFAPDVILRIFKGFRPR